jgi:photosystem II stability/assembly factor-like uncharacterized protein
MRKNITGAFASLLLGITTSIPAFSQDAWKIIDSGTSSELRGLSVVSKDVAWASGAKGVVLRTIDGHTWQNVSIADAATLDFRDIQGFDKMTAIAMSAGPGQTSRIYKTIDGGAHWELMTINSDASGFWDAIDFWDANNGIVFGDPVNGQFQLLVTKDGGRTWLAAAKDASQLTALTNEGAFAASGTCISVKGKSQVWFATGGAAISRVFHSNDRGKTWQNAKTGIPAAAAPKGLFSVAFGDGKTGLAVGGDYQKPNGDTLNAALTHDGGITWQDAPALPKGFLSVVTVVPGTSRVFVVGGLAGSGVSKDGGKTWRVLGQTPLNAVAFSDKLNGWAVGPKGLVMKYVGRNLIAQ